MIPPSALRLVAISAMLNAEDPPRAHQERCTTILIDGPPTPGRWNLPTWLHLFLKPVLVYEHTVDEDQLLTSSGRSG